MVAVGEPENTEVPRPSQFEVLVLAILLLMSFYFDSIDNVDAIRGVTQGARCRAYV